MGTGRTDGSKKVFSIERTGFPTFPNRYMTDDQKGRYVLREFGIRPIIDEETGCWHWPLAVSEKGYGKWWWNSSTTNAHRWMLGQVKGRAIKRKYDVDHCVWAGCAYRDCVRPSHLEQVTRAENIRRGKYIGKMVESGVWCPEGHPYNNDNTRYEYDPLVGISFRSCKTCNPVRVKKMKSASARKRSSYGKAA